MPQDETPTDDADQLRAKLKSVLKNQQTLNDMLRDAKKESDDKSKQIETLQLDLRAARNELDATKVTLRATTEELTLSHDIYKITKAQMDTKEEQLNMYKRRYESEAEMVKSLELVSATQKSEMNMLRSQNERLQKYLGGVNPKAQRQFYQETQEGDLRVINKELAKANEDLLQKFKAQSLQLEAKTVERDAQKFATLQTADTIQRNAIAEQDALFRGIGLEPPVRRAHALSLPGV